jgi:DNA polymerase-3 subunit epsilon
MRDALHSYLLERPAGATPNELLDLVFTQPLADRELGPRFLQTLLSGDARFAFRAEQGRWIATLHEALQRPLDESGFVVVDLETTGGAPLRGDRIIEIGAVRVRNNQIVERFATFVDPERRLPRFITRLTGIVPGMLAGQPRIRTALERFLEFAADDVLVAHNASFDLPFLELALRESGVRPLAQPYLCTLRLARRLLPLQRRRSLDALAARFGIPIPDRHRALGDANATVEIFFHLLELLRRRGILRVAEAIDFQHQASDGRRFVCLLPRARVEELPEAPGIYRFFSADDRLLYVGKAKNLRRRVASYASNAAAHSRKTLDLIRHVRRVEHEECGSELEAALREAEEIRGRKPPYNRLGKHLPRIAFVKLTAREPFPRLLVTTRATAARGSRLLGPLHGRESAREMRSLLARLFRLRTCTGRLRPDPGAPGCFEGQIGACSMPCRGATGEASYRTQVEDALAVFDGRLDQARAELERRRQRSAADLRFEAAERRQRELELLRRLERRQRTLRWLVEGRHCVVLQRDRRGGALLYVAAHGRLVERRRVRSAAELGEMSGRIEELISARTRPLDAEKIDATVILAAWLRERGERDGYVFPLAGDQSIEGQLPGWTAALESLLAVDPIGGTRADES